MCAAGWRTPRVDSLKFVKYAIIENAHKVENFRFIIWLLYVQILGGLNKYRLVCVPLWSIRLNCQLMTKHTLLVAYRCAPVLAQKTKPETTDTSKNQLNQARWNRTALKFDSENQLNVHNYLQGWCNWTQPKKHPGVFKKAHLIQTNKNPTLVFSFEKCSMKLKVK